MFEAELNRKLPELRAHEDYLTSCIFGTLKYLPPNEGLFPFLNSSFNYRLNTSLENHLKLQNRELTHFDKVLLHFWPRSSIYGEPDLIITLEGSPGSFLIPVEIKYFSEKHGEEEEDQLRRYYIALETIEGRKTFSHEAIRQFTGDLLAFVYLTQFEAEHEIEETVRILEREGIKGGASKFFHLTWQDVSKQIERMLSKELEPYKKAIYLDIKELLTFKNLLPFTRFSELPMALSPRLLLEFPVFLDIDGTRHKRFTHFSSLPEELSTEFLSHFPTFFSQLTQSNALFKGFTEQPNDLKLEYKGNIYYGGL